MNRPSDQIRRGFRTMFAVVVVSTLASCSPTQEGPTRYVVRGQVTYDGKPVPAGFVTFSPSAERGNSGPGGGAPIVNGRFTTPRDKGVVGGAYEVRITGFDGKPATVEGEELPDGNPLFAPFTTTVDFAREDSVRDFDVPKVEPETPSSN